MPLNLPPIREEQLLHTTLMTAVRINGLGVVNLLSVCTVFKLVATQFWLGVETKSMWRRKPINNFSSILYQTDKTCTN